MTRYCLSCNRPFPGRRDAKTCSPLCRKRLQRLKLKIINDTQLPIAAPVPLPSVAPAAAVNSGMSDSLGRVMALSPSNNTYPLRSSNSSLRADPEEATISDQRGSSLSGVPPNNHSDTPATDSVNSSSPPRYRAFFNNQELSSTSVEAPIAPPEQTYYRAPRPMQSTVSSQSSVAHSAPEQLQSASPQDRNQLVTRSVEKPDVPHEVSSTPISQSLGPHLPGAIVHPHSPVLAAAGAGATPSALPTAPERPPQAEFATALPELSSLPPSQQSKFTASPNPNSVNSASPPLPASPPSFIPSISPRTETSSSEPSSGQPPTLAWRLLTLLLLILILALGWGTKYYIDKKAEQLAQAAAAQQAALEANGRFDRATIGYLKANRADIKQLRSSAISTKDLTVTGTATIANLIAGSFNFKTGSVSGEFTAGASSFGSLQVYGPTTLQDSLEVFGPTTLHSSLSVQGPTTLSSSLNVSGRVTLTGVPTGSGVSQGTLYINPASANPSDTLLGLAVNGDQKFKVDASGNVYAHSIILDGSVSGGDTTFNNLTVIHNTTLGSTTADDLVVNATTVFNGPVTVGGSSSFSVSSGSSILGGSLDVAGIATFTHTPTQAHSFSPWPSGTSNADDASLYVNPSSAVADSNLIAAAVNGSTKFLVDAEGDVYANNLILTGSTSTGSTTVAGDLAVEGNTTLGDATTDHLTVNAHLASSLIPTVTNTYDLGSASLGFANVYANTFNGNLNGNVNGTITPTGFTQGSVVFAGTGGTLTQDNPNFFWDDTNNRLGVGTNTPSQLLSVGSSGQLTVSSAGNLSTSGTIATTGSSGITSAGTLTASNGLSLTTGALNLISTSGSAALTLNSSTTAFNIQSGLFDIDTTNGRVGIGTAAPTTFKLQVAGSIGPSVTNTYNLGSASLGFANVYANTFNGNLNGNVSGTITPSGFTQGSVVFAGSGGTLSQDNPNFFWDDTNNRLGVGTNTPSTLLNLVSNSAIADGIQLTQYADAAAPSFTLQRANGSSSSPTAVTSSQSTGSLNFQGWDGSQFISTARIDSIVDGTPGAGSVPGKLLFRTQAANATGAPATRMVIDSAGRVGIGNTVPGVALQVGGGSALSYSSGTVGYGTGTPQIYSTQTSGEASIGVIVNDGTDNRRAKLFVDQTNGIWGLMTTASTTASPFVIASGNTERLRIDTAGNVGIGTTSPTAKLTVSTNTANLIAGLTGTIAHFAGADTTNTRILIDAFGSGVSGVLNFRRSEGTAANPTAVLTNDSLGSVAFQGYGSTGYSNASRVRIQGVAAENWTDAAQGTYITFSNTPIGSTTLIERMRIDNNGNIGIGTTTPNSPLEVNGDIRITSSSGGQIIFADGSTMSTANTGSAAALSNSTDAIITGDSDANGSGNILFKIGSTEYGRFLNNGNFGLGTTSPGAQLDVVSTTAAGTVGRITANSLTTGIALQLTSSSTGLTSGSMLSVSSATTGAVATNGIVSLNATGNYTSTGNVGLLNVVAVNTTAGTLARIAGNALTTGNGLRISSTSTGLTTGSLLFVTSATTGAVNTNGIVSLNATGNYTSTNNNGLLNVLANATLSGTIENISGNALTTGKALNVASTSNAVTSATLINSDLTQSAATGNMSSNLNSMTYNPTYSTAIVGPTISGSVLNVSRNVTTNGAFADNLTITGAVASFSASSTATTGTITSSASVVEVTQNSASNTGKTLYVKSFGADSGNAFQVDDSSGDTTPFVIDNTGRVGIGTSSPGSKLDAYNPTSSSDVDIFRLLSDVGGAANVKFRVDTDGDIFTDGSTTIGTPADVAEKYRNNDGATPGDVVVFADSNTVEKSSSAAQVGLAGVVSTKPGVILAGDTRGVAVALAGRVPVKVSTANGVIHKGDYVTSAAGGMAQKATQAGPTLGTALEDASVDGVVEIFVHLGYYYPSGTETAQGGNTDPQSNSQNGAFTTLNVSGTTTLNTLVVKSSANFKGKLNVAELVVNGNLYLNGHVVTAGQTPSAVAGSAAGGASTTSIVGNDQAGTVTLKGGSSLGKGMLISLRFNRAYGQPPRVLLTPANPGAGDLRFYVKSTNSGFTIYANSAAASKELVFNYWIVQ